ncbi:hypothetical protein BH18ACI5_BH18ACI5_07850 [soil metagenome]
MHFPLDARFKLLALASQISVTDASGALIYYAKQKAFKLKEAVTVYDDEEQTRPLFRVQADRILDISGRYRIEDAGGAEVGVLKRHGMASIWRAHYDLEIGGRVALTIREDNPWTKVLDGLLGSIPILGIFSGYFLHPAYVVSPAPDDLPLLRAVKKPALFEGKFEILRLEHPDDRLVQPAVIALLMMLLLDRYRG